MKDLHSAKKSSAVPMLVMALFTVWLTMAYRWLLAGPAPQTTRLLALVGAAGVCFVLCLAEWLLMIPKVKKPGKTAAIVSAAGAVLIAAVLVLHAMYPPAQALSYAPQTLDITVEAEAEDGPAQLTDGVPGKNVLWLEFLSTSGTHHNLEDYANESWVFTRNILVYSPEEGTKTSTLSIPLQNPGGVELAFNNSGWQGTVALSCGGVQQTLAIGEGGFAPDESAPASWEFAPIQTPPGTAQIALWALLALLCLGAGFFGLAGVAARLPFCRAALSCLLAVCFGCSAWLVAFDVLSLALSALAAYLLFAAGLRLAARGAFARLAQGRTAQVFFFLIAAFATFLFVYNKIVVTPRDVRLGAYGLPGAAFIALNFGLACAFGLGVLHLLGQVKETLASRAAQRPGQKAKTPVGLTWLLLFFIMTICWSVWFLAFYPGAMSPDSIGQWSTAIGLYPLDDAHPVLSTLWVKLFATLVPHPAFYVVCQVGLLAAAYAAILAWWNKNGIPQGVCTGLALLFGLLPNLGIYAVTMWKDVPFLMALLWLAFLFARAATKKRLGWGFVAEAAIALSMVALFRHNGFIIALVCGATLLVLAFRRRLVLLAAAALAGLVLSLSLTAVTEVIFKPTHYEVGLRNRGTTAVATTIYYDGDIPEDILAEATADRTIDQWKEIYTPFSILNMVYGDYNYSAIYHSKTTGEILDIWFRLLAKNPGLIVHDMLATNDTTLFVNPSPHPQQYISRYADIIAKNDLGFATKQSEMTDPLWGLLFKSGENAFFDSLLWRNGLWIILCLWLMYFMFTQKRRWRAVYFIPMVANIISLMPAMAEQGSRFTHNILPYALVGVLLAVLPNGWDENTGLYTPRAKAPAKTPAKATKEERENENSGDA